MLTTHPPFLERKVVMQKLLKFSKYVHFFNKENMVAIFHAITRSVVFVKKAELTQIQEELSGGRRMSGTTRRCLFKKGILVSSTNTETRSIKTLQKSILQHPSIDTMYLLLTDQCNFACRYCFFEGSYTDSKKKYVHMSEEGAFTAIHNYVRYYKKAFSFDDFVPNEACIIFYGGEPLINKAVFFKAVEEIERLKKSSDLPKHLRLSINTNGSTITEEIAIFCLSHKIEVDISLDGYESVHDECRIWSGSGKGTFKDVMRAINILKKVGTNTCISCTVSETNVDSLPEIYKWFLDEVKIRDIGFNPLLNSCQYKITDPNYPNRITRAMIRCFEIARERGVYEARIMRKVKAFVEKTLYDRDCCGCGKQIVVHPSGNLGVCHAYSGTGKFFVVPDKEFDPYSHPIWNEWSKRSPVNMPQCQSCEALTICGGGCPHNAEINNGSIWEIDQQFCVHAKETLQWLIWDLYVNSK